MRAGNLYEISQYYRPDGWAGVYYPISVIGPGDLLLCLRASRDELVPSLFLIKTGAVVELYGTTTYGSSRFVNDGKDDGHR